MGSAWMKTRAATEKNYIALQFHDADYRLLAEVRSDSLQGDEDGRRVSVNATAPANTRWMRAVLHSEGNEGAMWCDDVAVERVPRSHPSMDASTREGDARADRS